MTVQATLTLANMSERDDIDLKHEDNQTDEEKNASPVTARTSSVSSDEKQTFGVAKVEAITTVWTREALVVLYAL